MANLDKEIAGIDKILKKEISRVKKSTTWNIISTVLILSMILVYYVYVSASLKTILNEKEIALIAREWSLEAIPSIKKDLEKEMKAAAPDIVSTVLGTAEKTIPVLRAEANAKVKDAVPQLMKEVDLILHLEIQEKASPYRSSIADIVAKMSDSKLAEEEFENLEAVIEQAFFDEIDHIIDMAYMSLAQLNGRVDNVLNVDDMTEEQLLEKKFLKMWVNFFKWGYQEK